MFAKLWADFVQQMIFGLKLFWGTRKTLKTRVVTQIILQLVDGERGIKFWLFGLRGFNVPDSDCDEDDWENVSAEGRFNTVEKDEGEDLSNEDGDNMSFIILMTNL